MNAIKLWWTGLGAREQRMVSIAVTLVGLAMLWTVAISPALKTLRSASKEHAAADAQLQSMKSQAEQATSLRAQRALGYDESLRNLENSVKQTLGAGATLSVNDTRASLALKGVSADALALWLGQARINARVVPSEARLQRSGANTATATATANAGTATTAASATGANWDGVMVLTLPPR
jgi:general secretion pathway protein M